MPYCASFGTSVPTVKEHKAMLLLLTSTFFVSVVDGVLALVIVVVFL